jgi:hypothetical protein
MKRTLCALSTAVVVTLVAALAGAQEAANPDTKTGTERQFKGEIVSVDQPQKMFTVKTSVQDSKGAAQEKTLTLPVKDKAEEQLQTLQAGDRVNVLWRTESDGHQIVISIVKLSYEHAQSQ